MVHLQFCPMSFIFPSSWRCTPHLWLHWLLQLPPALSVSFKKRMQTFSSLPIRLPQSTQWVCIVEAEEELVGKEGLVPKSEMPAYSPGEGGHTPQILSKFIVLIQRIGLSASVTQIPALPCICSVPHVSIKHVNLTYLSKVKCWVRCDMYIMPSRFTQNAKWLFDLYYDSPIYRIRFYDWHLPSGLLRTLSETL